MIMSLFNVELQLMIESYFICSVMILLLTQYMVHAEVAISFQFDALSNATEVAQRGCEGAVPSCERLARPAIEMSMHVMYDYPLSQWKHSNSCRSIMPNQQELPFIQHFHIPKTGGTAFNFILHDYAGCPIPEGMMPCEVSITSIDPLNAESSMLCNGRLFSCAGHRVSPHLLKSLLSEATNAVTMLRHPWNRLQSDYHYIKSKPHTTHLSPEIDVAALLQHTEQKVSELKIQPTTPVSITTATNQNQSSIRQQQQQYLGLHRFIHYPGISNCMTKMLNGFQCGDRMDRVLDQMLLGTATESSDSTGQVLPVTRAEAETILLANAKKALQALLFVGIQEKFDLSICLFVWMYGSGSSACGDSSDHDADCKTVHNGSNELIGAADNGTDVHTNNGNADKSATCGGGYSPSKRSNHFAHTRVGRYEYIPIPTNVSRQHDQSMMMAENKESFESAAAAAAVMSVDIAEIYAQFEVSEHLDLALYAYAVTLFESRVAQTQLNSAQLNNM